MRTRRYHALLLAATRPPAGRMVLVNGLEAWLETAAGRFALSIQHYTPDVTYPDGSRRIVGFDAEPWPRWTFRAEDGTEVTQEIVAHHDHPEVALRWRLAAGTAKLILRPLMSGRDYHALHHENPAFDFSPEISGERLTWRPYQGVPAITLLTNGRYDHQPTWYRGFRYEAERERGLDFVEDLASPGVLTFELGDRDAVLVLGGEGENADARADAIFTAEAARRKTLGTPMQRAADAYVVRRGEGRTIIAGYPWFTDWGRDTFIALRGFMTLPGGLDLARENPAGLGAHGIARHGAEPLSRPGHRARVQRGGCVALVRGCGGRLSERGTGRERCRCPAPARGDRPDRGRLSRRHPLWHPHGRRMA